ncbi:hypothetical protein QBC47DRAFT_93719 [Echria macrotheca]|uniref:Nephrocystin 3-like N-terminal domain-containing protein n=1 Tax=Echria macrotheca TaxID=438768 RepID=A0AAJ0F129_9PEZI|nr:hypothetical protein QBC47DRAFT_93719 [Echria macrotheca]
MPSRCRSVRRLLLGLPTPVHGLKYTGFGLISRVVGLVAVLPPFWGPDRERPCRRGRLRFGWLCAMHAAATYTNQSPSGTRLPPVHKNNGLCTRHVDLPPRGNFVRVLGFFVNDPMTVQWGSLGQQSSIMRSLLRRDPPPLGLSVLCAPDSEQLTHLDIILVHGIRGHPVDSWEDDGHSLWSAEQDRVRVLTFRHTITAKRPCDPEEISRCSETLLREVARCREKQSVDRFRPIIFVGHNVGGIIVKQAYRHAHLNHRYSDILYSIYGVIFFGTPHRSFGTLSWNEVFRRLSLSSQGLMRRYAPIDLDEQVKKWLDSTSKEFRNSSGELGLMIVSFTESQSISGQSKIVEGNSAKLDQGSECIELDGHHYQICKLLANSGEIWKALHAIEKQSPRADYLRPERRKALLSLGVARFRPSKCNVTLSPGTCTWIENQEVFQSWYRRSTDKRRLWIWGARGCGKTHLARHISGLDDVKSDTVASCFLGDIIEGERSASSVLLCLMHEILLALPPLIGQCLETSQSAIDDREALRNNHRRLETLWRQVLDRATKSGPVTLIIDGLDQCEDTKDVQYRFLNWISANAGGFRHIDKNRLRVLVLSSDQAPMADHLPKFLTFNIRGEHTQSDILAIAQNSAKWIAKRHKNKDLEQKITEQIVNGAKGMHLWAHIMLSQLQTERKLNEEKLSDMLKNQQPGMISCYESIFKSIAELRHEESGHGRSDHEKSSYEKTPPEEFVRNVLFWLTYQIQPMNVDELRMAYELTEVTGLMHHAGGQAPIQHVSKQAVDRINESPKGNFAGLVYQRCKGLVAMNKSNGATVLSLIHPSLGDYLRNRSEALEKELKHTERKSNMKGLKLVCHKYYHRFGDGEADMHIANICIAYLLLDYFDDAGPAYVPGPDRDRNWAAKVQRRIKDHRFCSYAAVYWHEHVGFAALDSQEKRRRPSYTWLWVCLVVGVIVVAVGAGVGAAVSKKSSKR